MKVSASIYKTNTFVQTYSYMFIRISCKLHCDRYFSFFVRIGRMICNIAHVCGGTIQVLIRSRHWAWRLVIKYLHGAPTCMHGRHSFRVVCMSMNVYVGICVYVCMLCLCGKSCAFDISRSNNTHSFIKEPSGAPCM